MNCTDILIVILTSVRNAEKLNTERIKIIKGGDDLSIQKHTKLKNRK